jgi:hypothetical protein
MDDDRYSRWKQSRREAAVPDVFTDRVMAAVRGCEPPRRPFPAGLFLVLFSPRLTRTAVVGLACLACLFRMLQVLAIFFPE